MEEPNSYIFLINGDTVLLEVRDDNYNIPEISTVKSGVFNHAFLEYLGMYCGKKCFAAEYDAGYFMDKNYSLYKLRSLYGQLPDELFRLTGKALHVANWRVNNKFCGRCGSVMDRVIEERALKCTSCANLVYPRISPAVISQ
jgi:NAD+ diphosphatase